MVVVEVNSLLGVVVECLLDKLFAGHGDVAFCPELIEHHGECFVEVHGGVVEVEDN